MEEIRGIVEVAVRSAAFMENNEIRNDFVCRENLERNVLNILDNEIDVDFDLVVKCGDDNNCDFEQDKKTVFLDVYLSNRVGDIKLSYKITPLTVEEI